MKRLFGLGIRIIPLYLMLLLVSCGGNDGKFRIEGSFRGMNQGELYIYGINGTFQLDTINLARGEFKYQVSMEDPTTLVLVFPNFSELPIFAKSGATVEIKGDAKTAQKFIDNLPIFSLLANVADVKSLVIHPASTTHSQLTEVELNDQGIKPNTIRLSIGIEKAEDLIAALEAAFAAVK